MPLAQTSLPEWSIRQRCIYANVAMTRNACSEPISTTSATSYRLLSYVPLGLLAGIAVEKLRARAAPAAWALMAVLLLPMVVDLHQKLRKPANIDAFVERGVALHHADPEQDALYRWLSTQTSPRAAVIDSYLTVPVFARRALFVATDARRFGFFRRYRVGPYQDGWGMFTESALAQVVGSPPAEQRARLIAARAALAGRQLEVASRRLALALGRGDIEELYVVSRDAGAARALEAAPGFARVFGNEVATVFRFTPAADASGT